MSIVRRSPVSDVYVWESIDDCIVCQSCALRRHGANVRFRTYEAMDGHLQAHVAAGHLVPMEAFDSLLECSLDPSAWMQRW